jgi:hypothetical protein
MLLCVVPTPPNQLRRPEDPRLAGRYVARVSRMVFQTDASILRLPLRLCSEPALSPFGYAQGKLCRTGLRLIQDGIREF